MIEAGRWKQVLHDSEDSETLNTSFVERLNLTIRQGSAYLGRRTIHQARWKHCLGDHLELLRCHYNFVRPRWGLKFARVVRTPAMQAGLTKRPLSFREIFPLRLRFVTRKNVLCGLLDSVSRLASPCGVRVLQLSNS
jgi:hypothetical protein